MLPPCLFTCLFAQCSVHGTFPICLQEEMAAALPLGAPKMWWGWMLQSSQEVALSRLIQVLSHGSFPYLGNCTHISCCFQTYSAAMWGRGLWQPLWLLSSWLGTAVCSFCLQEFAPELDPKHSIKTKVMSLVPQTAVRLCFVPPSFTTAS